MNSPYIEFEFKEIESSLRQMQEFQKTPMFRDIVNYWHEQLEMTKRDLLVCDDIEEVRRLQGMAETAQQGILLIDAFINYLKEDE